MKEPKGKRRISAEGKKRMATAGLKNLTTWRARVNTRTQELEAQVTGFRDGLLRDAGPNLTTTKAGLIEAAVLTFTCILKLRHSVIHSSKSSVADLGEKSSWSCSNLARLLKLLNLDARSRPRSLSEVFARKDAASATKAVESGGNPS